MKKFLLAFLAVLGLCFITYTPVHATSVTIPFSDVPALYYSFGTIAAGGTINLEDYDNPQDYIADLNRLLRGQEIQNNHYGLTSKTSKVLFNTLASLALNGVTELSEDDSLILSYDNINTAQFMGYDKNYYKYLISSGEDVIIPTPDVNYISYLNTINADLGLGLDFFFKNYSRPTKISGTYDFNIFTYPYYNYTFYCTNSSGLSNGAFSTRGLFASNIADLNIYSVNSSTYTFDLTLTPIYIGDMSMAGTQNVFQITFNNGNLNWESFGNLPNAQTFSRTGSLNDVLSYATSHFRNLNIYVDGVLWSLSGGVAISNPPILAPDVIGVGDLPDDTYGVLGLSDPANLDLGAFLGWLNDMFDLGKDVIGLGDLVDEGDLPFLRTKDTDTDIDLDDTNVIPAEQVIDDPKTKEEEDEDTNPDPTPPDPDPPFPAPLPPILPIPDPNITPRQTTVLSEIIQATDTVVPSELMTLIWSTFGLLVVGGLIYILHK